MLRDTEFPLGLSVLVERLNFRYRGPHPIGRFQTFDVDLSEWGLSLSHATPCIWVKESDLASLSAADVVISLRDVAHERKWQNATILLFIDGPAEALRPHLPSEMPKFIIIEGDDQRRIAQADSPSRLMLDVLMRQMSRSDLAPYETSEFVIGSRFFGREKEINQIRNHPEKNYLVRGLRRAGKTSLIKEVIRRLDDADPEEGGRKRRLYVDCTVLNSEEDFYHALAAELDPLHQKELLREGGRATRYRKLMFGHFYSIHGGTITFFLDEFDRLLSRIGSEDSLIPVMRSASAEKISRDSTIPKVRFILSGFRMNMSSANGRDTTDRFADPIDLGPLVRNEVIKMIVGPLERLRISIANPTSVVARIHRETAGLPHYIQLYCHTLLEMLDETQRDTLTEDDLQYVYDSLSFQDYVVQSFKEECTAEEKAIVYALIAEPHNPAQQPIYTLRQIDDVLKEHAVSLRGDVLDNCCRHLLLAGVFNREGGTGYAFAVPIFQQILRDTRDIELLLEKSIEEIDLSRLLV